MKIQKLYCAIIFFICIYAGACAQVIYQRAYRPASNNQFAFYSIASTPDNGYVFSGAATSNNNSEDGFILKTNSLGDTVFSRFYGGPEFDAAASVAAADDSGFFIGGHTWGFATQEIDYYLIRTDKYGDTLWTRLISHPTGGLEYCHKVIQTSDHNFAAFGSQSTFSGNFYLNKWGNTTGNLLWSKVYGGNFHDWGFDMQQTTDNGFIMTGFTASFANTDTNVFVVKADSAGTVQWAKSYGGSSIDIGYGIRQTADGGYIIAGTSLSFSNGIPKIYLIKTNSAGDTLWTRIYNTSLYINYWFYRNITLDVTTDGGFIMCFGKYTNAGNFDVALLKTDSAGTIEWFKNYGTTDDEIGYAVLHTNDGGCIATGESQLMNPYEGVYVIKTDANGYSGCNETNDTTSWSYTNTIVAAVTPTVSSNGTVKSTGTITNAGVETGTLCTSVGMDEIANAAIFTLFPNPAGNLLSIEKNSNLNQDCCISIYDVRGIQMLNDKTISGETIKINVSSWAPGLYFIRLKTRSTVQTQRFVKQ